MGGMTMNRPGCGVPQVLSRRHSARLSKRDRRWLASIAAAVLVLAVADRADADVTRSGDVNPAFTPGAVVDLTGQRIFIGNTSGSVGGIGTVTVNAGGILTA